MGEFIENSSTQFTCSDTNEFQKAASNNYSGLNLLALLDGPTAASNPNPRLSLLNDPRDINNNIEELILPSIFEKTASSALRSELGASATSLPPLRTDYSHYGIDPVTGQVREYPSVHTDIWTNADGDAAKTISKRGYAYGLDPVSGEVTAIPNVRTSLYTAADAARANTIDTRGWSYALNPATGQTVRVPVGPVLE